MYHIRVFKDKRGYIMLYRPSRSTYSNGYIFRSHDIYENINKCCILPWAIIHHINGIVDDDSISNLELLSRGRHTRHHHINTEHVDMSNRLCSDCTSPNTYMRKMTGDIWRPEWYCLGNGFICGRCYMRRRRQMRRIT